jgi:hypothetical protein
LTNLDHSQAPPVRATVECHRTRWRLRSAGRRRPELGNGPLRRPAGPPIALEPSIKGRSSPSCCSNRAVADLAAHWEGYRSGGGVGHAIAIQRADHPLYCRPGRTARRPQAARRARRAPPRLPARRAVSVSSPCRRASLSQTNLFLAHCAICLLRRSLILSASARSLPTL